MTQTKHTPLPWMVDNRRSIVKVRSEKREVAVLSGRLDSEHGRETIQANAAFIARACNSHDELLEALENIVKYAEQGCDCLCDAKELENAKIIIKKARG